VHTAIFEHSNIQSTIKDPVIIFLVKQNSTKNQSYLPLPAKLFVNYTDNSVLHIHESDGSQLLKSQPIFKKYTLLIAAMCTKNTLLREGHAKKQKYTYITHASTNYWFISLLKIAHTISLYKGLCSANETVACSNPRILPISYRLPCNL